MDSVLSFIFLYDHDNSSYIIQMKAEAADRLHFVFRTARDGAMVALPNNGNKQRDEKLIGSQFLLSKVHPE